MYFYAWNLFVTRALIGFDNTYIMQVMMCSSFFISKISFFVVAVYGKNVFSKLTSETLSQLQEKGEDIKEDIQNVIGPNGKVRHKRDTRSSPGNPVDLYTPVDLNDPNL